MPVLICPRCRHVNPEYATYCSFDGVVLQANQSAAVLRLPREFAFPSGRRCQTFDDLAQGCQEEWPAARDLLLRGAFAQFFRSCNRADLVRAAEDARAQTTPDIALMTFLNALPGTRTATPKLDLSPRRILVGTLVAGESRSLTLTITNAGQGMLQGTVAIVEGQDWLSLSDAKPMQELTVEAVREQVVPLHIRTKGIVAGQAYGARLTVITNGGVVEVPLKMELAAQPYPRPPFQGVRTQRDLAEKIRQHAKAAVPILESGEVQRWFAANGWIYPVQGTPVKGVAGVQQFFEAMGKSKPPTVQLSQGEFRFSTRYRDTIRGQVTLLCKERKWVYAHVTSDHPWLKVLNPEISGPQRATLPFEVDTKLWTQGPTGEGKLTFTCNGNQKLTLKVVVEVAGAPTLERPRPPVPAATSITPAPAATFAPPMPTPTAAQAPGPSVVGRVVPPLVTMVLVCVLLRLLLVPFVDLWARSSLAQAAADKVQFKPSSNSPLLETGGWLRLPWLTILGAGSGSFSASVFQPGSNAEVSAADFRHYFASYFMRWFTLRTWWLGSLLGGIILYRRGGVGDVPWGVVAGTFAGVGVAASIAAFFLVVETIPHALYSALAGGRSSAALLALWIVLALLSWTMVGIVLGVALPRIAPLRRLLVDPFQRLLAQMLGFLGLRSLAASWLPA